MIKGIAEAHNAVKQELFLIRNKQAEQSSENLGSAKPPASSDIPSEKPPQAMAYVPPPGQKSASSSTRQPLSSSRSSVKPSSDTRVSAPKQVKEKKTLFIGDSNSANVE